MVVLIDNQNGDGKEVLKILGEHACLIKTHLGMFETSFCKDAGMMILQLNASKVESTELENSLQSIDGVKTKNISLDFE
jgi:hypothetical protein